MPHATIDRLIINSPYEEPQRHWRYDREIKLKEIMGRYDVVVVTEAPDDETISRAMLSLGSVGNVRTETLRAFSAQEMGQLLNSLL
jgi:uncharacterized protein with GYD domain